MADQIRNKYCGNVYIGMFPEAWQTKLGYAWDNRHLAHARDEIKADLQMMMRQMERYAIGICMLDQERYSWVIENSCYLMSPHQIDDYFTLVAMVPGHKVEGCDFVWESVNEPDHICDENRRFFTSVRYVTNQLGYLRTLIGYSTLYKEEAQESE